MVGGQCVRVKEFCAFVWRNQFSGFSLSSRRRAVKHYRGARGRVGPRGIRPAEGWFARTTSACMALTYTYAHACIHALGPVCVHGMTERAVKRAYILYYCCTRTVSNEYLQSGREWAGASFFFAQRLFSPTETAPRRGCFAPRTRGPVTLWCGSRRWL